VIALRRSGGLAGVGADDTVAVTATLNVTVREVDMVDPWVRQSAVSVVDWPGADGVLAPGQPLTYRPAKNAGRGGTLTSAGGLAPPHHAHGEVSAS